MTELIIEQIKKNKIYIKYIISGGTTAAVDLGFLYIFTDIFHIWYIASAALAFILAFFVSFFLQKFWTFRDRSTDGIYKQMWLYFIVATINMVLNTLLMYIFVDWFNIWYMLAQVFVGIFIAIWNFIISKFFIFNQTTVKNLKKIVIATGIFPPDIGGPATYSYSLAPELVKLGYKVAIVTYGDNKIKNYELKINNSEIEIHNIYRHQNIIKRYCLYFLEIWKLTGDTGIIYALDIMSAGLPSVIVAKLRGKKAVFRTGGDFLWEKAIQKNWTALPLEKYYEAHKNLPEKFYFLLCRIILKSFKEIIFSTELQARIYKRFYRVPEEKIKFIKNAFEISEGSNGIGNFSNSIIFAGRLIKLKNIDRLITAFKKISSDKNIKLHIFGNGPEEDHILELIKAQSLNDQVFLHNRISHQELINVIKSCLFVIVPSLTEISPNLALECIALGKPVILTKENGLDMEINEMTINIDPLNDQEFADKMSFLMDEDNRVQFESKLKQLSMPINDWKYVASEHAKLFEKKI